ncbi:cytochrome P450 302a1, mitochondrial isoform X1 [Galleria mellonella]|uniref:Cytochrome P450 302a1, mitochondrial isoform X1 n=1 Tax=Galleria mellonella TaxID=7137 RepID=A0A6J3CAB1_GALME|nr:cytochrome P450 302a1, mitochondrial isoform X1 [Galleria mellonella]
MFKFVQTKINNALLNKKCVNIKLRLKKISDQPSKDNNGDSGLKKFDEIPGPKSYPLIGTLYKYLPFIGDYDAEALDKNAWLNWKRYGTLVREEPGVNVLHVFEPDDIEAVFRQDHRYPARRSHVAMQHYRVNKPHLYNTGGLLSTNGPDWWRLRSTFQKNFTGPESVKSHVKTTDCVVKEFVHWIKEKKLSAHEDFLFYLNRLNLEIIGVVAFNERFQSFSQSEQNSNSRSSKTIAAAFGSNSGIMKLDKGFLWKFFKTPLYKKLVESQDYLGKISIEILLKRIKFFEENKTDSDQSLLASFLLQPNVDIKDIVGMMVDILMAAIDTTAYTTSFALYHISLNPDCQEKMYKEIVSFLPEKNSDITPEILSKMNYVRSVIKESLRLNPVAIGVGRLLQKDIIIRDYLIPKGTVVVTQNMLASRLPLFVKDPLAFKPERWLRASSNYENLHPFLSLPFGFGPRSCIARRLAEQNICITLIRVIREFEIKWNGGELGVRTYLINKPDQPVALSFIKRSM